MTIWELLSAAKKILREGFSERSLHTPDLDTEVLLAETLGVSREHLFTHSAEQISPEKEAEFRRRVKKRQEGTPVSHLLGYKNFFGLDFFIDANVLTPRPETEILVEKVLETVRGYDSATIWDIGTGSGCIILTLAKSLPPNYTFLASDISGKALRVAKKNSQRLGIKNVSFFPADLLTNIPRSQIKPPLFFVLNLPYVPAQEQLLREVSQYDPHLALFGGNDGLDIYRRFFTELKARPELSWHSAFFEFHPPQRRTLKAFLARLFPRHALTFAPDLSGALRFGILASPQAL